MAIRPIRVVGDPVLRLACKPVTTINDFLYTLIEDMLETMYEAPGVGLAAPQVGINKQVVVFDIGDGPQCLINPEIISKEGEEEGEEGCLSVPGRQRIIKRACQIKVKALDLEGQEQIITFEGFPARVVQHELDHLQGRLIIDSGRDAPPEED